MKLFQSALVAGIFTTRLIALETAEITAVSARFATPDGDGQYQARIELNRLVDQATLPGKGDPAAVTKILVQVIQSPETSLEAKKYLLRALGRVGTADAIASLAPLLSANESLVREEARYALASIPDPEAVAALQAALLKTKDLRDKLGLVNSLGTCKSEAAVAVLAPLLADSNPESAAAAVTAMARIGGAQADVALKKAWSSGKVSPALKPALEEAILMANPSDTPGLMLIYQKTESDVVRTAAFIALMKSSPAGSASALIEGALKSPSADLRRVAITTGIRSGVPALQTTIAGNIADMSKEDRLVALANIDHLKPVGTAEKTALDALAKGDEDERVIALAALGRIATKPAFDAVFNALGAREPRVNQAAANALSGMNYPGAESSLLAMLKGAPGPEKVLAIKATTSRELDGASGILLEILKGSDEASVKESMKSLYFIATIEDLKVLCAEAGAAKDEAFKRSLSGLCSKIAARIKTPEALRLVKPLE